LDASENTDQCVHRASTSQRVTRHQILSRCLEFMRTELPCWREASDSDLYAWLGWHFDMGLLAPIGDERTGKLAALLAVRSVDNPEDFENDYAHHRGGKICIAELLIATDPQALEVAIVGLAARIGFPVYLMHGRPWRLEPKIMLWSKFERHLRKLYAQPENPKTT
jgi:hypothetical protein